MSAAPQSIPMAERLKMWQEARQKLGHQVGASVGPHSQGVATVTSKVSGGRGSLSKAGQTRTNAPSAYLSMGSARRAKGKAKTDTARGTGITSVAEVRASAGGGALKASKKRSVLPRNPPVLVGGVKSTGGAETAWNTRDVQNKDPNTDNAEQGLESLAQAAGVAPVVPEDAVASFPHTTQTRAVSGSAPLVLASPPFGRNKSNKLTPSQPGASTPASASPSALATNSPAVSDGYATAPENEQDQSELLDESLDTSPISSPLLRLREEMCPRLFGMRKSSSSPSSSSSSTTTTSNGKRRVSLSGPESPRATNGPSKRLSGSRIAESFERSRVSLGAAGSHIGFSPSSVSAHTASRGGAMLLHSPVTSPTGAHDWSEHRHEKSEERKKSENVRAICATIGDGAANTTDTHMDTSDNATDNANSTHVALLSEMETLRRALEKSQAELSAAMTHAHARDSALAQERDTVSEQLQEAGQLIVGLQNKLQAAEEVSQGLQVKLLAANTANKDAESTAETRREETVAVRQDLEATLFLNSVLEQRVDQLEAENSSAQITLHEEVSDLRRKHKADVRRLHTDRIAYEDRANGMITQMNEQMQALQIAAMGRIETLEKELMEERRLREDAEARALAASQEGTRSAQKLRNFVRGAEEEGEGIGVSPSAFLHLEMTRGGRSCVRGRRVSSVSNLSMDEEDDSSQCSGETQEAEVGTEEGQLPGSVCNLSFGCDDGADPDVDVNVDAGGLDCANDNQNANEDEEVVLESVDQESTYEEPITALASTD